MSRFDNNCLWITGRVHDRVPFPVLVGIIGGDGEAAYLGVSHPVEGGGPDDAPEFDFVHEFHGELYLAFDLFDVGPWRAPAAGEGKVNA